MENNCKHKKIKYFANKDIVLCLDCAEVWQRYTFKVGKVEKDLIIKMRKDGHTFAEIGKQLGVTRQRVQQIYKKVNN